MSRKSFRAPGMIGTSILLTVFLILCMITFAVTALVQADSEYQRSMKAETYMLAYTEAENTMEEEILTIQDSIRENSSPESVISLKTDIDEHHVLSVRLSYDGSQYRITEWKTVNTAEWVPDDTYHGFTHKGESAS